jgi:DsbC/DsbD-like thiol-disulfide interchange protein
MMTRILVLIALIFGPVALAPMARADSSMIEASILTGWRQDDGSHVAALQLSMLDGWKTYWRAPGDAGIPPRFDWAGSENLASVQITWPTPRSIDQGGIRTIGYSDTVIWPLTLTPARKDQPIMLAGKIELGVCKDICVPVTLILSQDLPKATQRDPRIVSALAARPYSAQEAGVTSVRCSVSPVEGGIRLRADLQLPHTGGEEIAVIETSNPAIWVAQAATTRRNGILTAETEMYHVQGSAFALDRSGLRITVIGEHQAVDIQGCPAN